MRKLRDILHISHNFKKPDWISNININDVHTSLGFAEICFKIHNSDEQSSLICDSILKTSEVQLPLVHMYIQCIHVKNIFNVSDADQFYVCILD